MDRIRKIADDFFREQGIKKLPIELDTVIDILEKRGWKVHLYSESENFIREKHLEKIRYTKDAFAMNADGVKAVFYDDELGVLQKVYALCHELGHDVIGHTGHGVVGKSKTPEDVIHEKEADAFALEFQAPAYKLYMDKIDSIDKIVRAGILSKDNAQEQYCNSYLQYAEEQEPPKAQADYIENTPTVKYELVRYNNKKRIWVLLGVVACVAALVSGTAMVTLHFSRSEPVAQASPAPQAVSTVTPTTQPTIIPTVAPTPIVTPEPTPAQTQAAVSAAGEKITVKRATYNANMTVYKTKTGKVYHQEGCRHLVGRDNIKTMTLQVAIAAGLDPCSDCFK